MAIQNSVSNQVLLTTSSPAFNALTLTSALTVANGGSGRNTAAAYALIAAGTTATGIQQSLGTGTAGQVLQSNGASALPTWTTAAFPSGSGTLNHMLRSDGTNWVETTALTVDASDVMRGLTQLNVDNLRLDGNTMSSTDTNGNVNVVPNGTGKVCLLQADGLTGSSALIQAIKNGVSVSSLLGSCINTSAAAGLYFWKTRGTTVGAFTAVQSGDNLGSQHYYGTDGSDGFIAAQVYARVDGSVSAGIVPGKFQWYTANTSGASSLGMTLDSSQNLTMATGSVYNTLGYFFSGSAAGGVQGAITMYSPTAANGSTAFRTSGNAGNYNSVLTNASTTAARTWTLPDASGTFLMTGLAISTVPSIAFSSTSGVIGTATNDSAAAGSVGELNSTVVLAGSAVSLSTGATSDIATLVLQPGDYDVWGEFWSTANAATLTASVVTSIGTTSATIASTPSANTSTASFNVALAAGVNITLPIASCRISVATATTTTVYLCANSVFSVNTLAGYGKIMSRRRR